jgi:hypothetical protein
VPPRPALVLIFLFRFTYFMCMVILLACVPNVCLVHTERPEEGVRTPGTGGIDGCELLCGNQTPILCKRSSYLRSHLSHSHLVFCFVCFVLVFETRSLFVLELTKQARLAVQRAPVTVVSPSAGIIILTI